MKAVTFNVNSVRARMPIVQEWLREQQPDLVALQETKVDDPQFPYADIEAMGYQAVIHGQKSYNGVAFLSKEPLDEVEVGYLPDWPRDCRVIRAVYKGIQFINTYVPNGTSVGSEKWDYKMRWLDHFTEYVNQAGSQNDPMIWLGDINVAPTPDDVFESKKHLGDVGHHPDEFEKLARIVDWGWQDMFRRDIQGEGHYTFWDYRMRGSLSRNLGWRIDHVYATECLRDRVVKVWCEKDIRALEKSSDHAPVWVDIQD